jgi:hypothetical protein
MKPKKKCMKLEEVLETFDFEDSSSDSNSDSSEEEEDENKKKEENIINKDSPINKPLELNLVISNNIDDLKCKNKSKYHLKDLFYFIENEKLELMENENNNNNNQLVIYESSDDEFRKDNNDKNTLNIIQSPIIGLIYPLNRVISKKRKRQ